MLQSVENISKIKACSSYLYTEMYYFGTMFAPKTVALFGYMGTAERDAYVFVFSSLVSKWEQNSK